MKRILLILGLCLAAQAQTFKLSSVAAVADSTITLTNLIQRQAALATSGDVTNFVANFDTAAYQLVTVADNVFFTHATNCASGKGTVILLANWCGTNMSLAIPSTWRQRGVEATLTNATVTVLSLYAYGADNTTNVLASCSWFK